MSSSHSHVTQWLHPVWQRDVKLVAKNILHICFCKSFDTCGCGLFEIFSYSFMYFFRCYFWPNQQLILYVENKQWQSVIWSTVEKSDFFSDSLAEEYTLFFYSHDNSCFMAIVVRFKASFSTNFWCKNHYSNWRLSTASNFPWCGIRLCIRTSMPCIQWKRSGTIEVFNCRKNVTEHFNYENLMHAEHLFLMVE